MMSANSLFLRLEGPMQAWGVQESKFVIRRTGGAPTKSGVIGLLCAALGVPRSVAAEEWLPRLSGLSMGVRIDAPGIRCWDYHTVGARMEMRIAEGEGKTKPGAMLTRREYLCDASFLVVLQGEPLLIEELAAALRHPKWALYLGRKSCPPSRPILDVQGGDRQSATGTGAEAGGSGTGRFSDLRSALAATAWRPRFKGEAYPETVQCLLDWLPTADQPEAPADALVWYDVPLTFEPPAHRPRFVVREMMRVGEGGQVEEGSPTQNRTPAPPRPRADYRNNEYRKIRKARLERDHCLCVFCKSPATTVQHITYRHAGGEEQIDELRSLCRLCHDAVTMVEYGLGMGMDRINPEEEQWRKLIIEKREEIIGFRSLETRRRRLAAEEVE